MENLKEKKSVVDFISRRNKFAIDPTTLSMLGFSKGDYFFDKRVGNYGLFTIGVFFSNDVDIFWNPFFYSDLSDEEKKSSCIKTIALVRDLNHLLSIFEKTTGQKFKI